MNANYKIAYNMYLALGGDPNAEFNNVDDVWNAVSAEFDKSGGITQLTDLEVDITSNGVYEYEPTEDIDGYKNVKVDVNVDVGSAYEDGYNNGRIDGITEQKSRLTDIEITRNGNYSTEDGYKNISVSVPAKLDFGVLGYDDSLSDSLNVDIQSDIDYSLSLYNKYGGVLKGSLSNYFNDNTKLVYFPLFDTTQATGMGQMFYGCTNLSVVPLFDTSNVTSMILAFYNCTSLTTVPLFDTSKVTSMINMFGFCSSLTSVPLFDTSKVTDMSNMFNNCKSLTSVPQFDISKVTNMSSMFSNCTSLTTVPLFDTSKVTNMSSMFNNCSSLTSLPQFYMSSISSTGYAALFSYSNINSITDVGGFYNLGKGITASSGTISNCCERLPNLKKESVLNILNCLYDRATAGMGVLTLKMHANHLAMLTDDEKAIATNKGWTLS